ncbi:YihY/virulence factor BrkB family protein [Nocardioides cynanchi]|uniref:YihY/virulence factor BrkB family protein n=1 Tax=Nocardioides cynanchi TaxID=2558918 RepID=UPI0012441EBA|nr:YhjD/YihY/BrkB family envelope integrity protein [Nocardioides cynanchi]
MASPLARAKALLGRARERSALVDHLVRMQAHYGRVNGSAQAGAVTYFAFLSFFPILALAFFVVGYLARMDSSAQDNLVRAVQQVLPGIVSSRNPPPNGEISIRSIEDAAGTVGLIGLAGVIYSGLGWLSGMRSALEVVFEMPRNEYPNFFVGKLRDLVTLVIIGVTLMLSVAVTGAVVGYSDKLLELLGLGRQLSWLVHLGGVVVGIGADMLLFYALFRLLARPRTPRRALWQGALLGGIGFEVLKLGSSYLLRATQHQPAFQAFGIALVLLVWINYFSRVVMYAAAWAHTSRPARAARDAVPAPAGPAPPAEPPRAVAPAPSVAAAGRADPRLAFVVGAATAWAVAALARRRRR